SRSGGSCQPGSDFRLLTAFATLRGEVRTALGRHGSGASMAPGSSVATPLETVVHRMGGGSMANLRLKSKEQTLKPPGSAVVLGGTAQEAAEQMGAAFPDPRKFARVRGQTRMVGSTTVAAIEEAGFIVFPDPSAKFPNHARLVHPDGVPGFANANLEQLARA